MLQNETNQISITKVIVVEDDKGISRVIAKKLQHNGFTVFLAYNVSEAADLFRADTDSFILADFMLGSETAFDLIKALRAIRNEIPFIIMTAHGDENLAVELMKLGALDYLVKDEVFPKLLIPRIIKAIDTVVTKRKLTNSENALSSSYHLYAELFENSKEGIYFVSLDGNFFNINDYMTQLFGYERIEMLGVHINEIYSNPNDRQTFINELEEKGYTKDYFLKLKKKDGTLLPCSVSASVIRNESGEVFGYQGILHDLSERIRYEESLEWEVSINSAYAEISNAINIGASITDISNIALNLALNITKSKFGFVGFIESETGMLITPASGTGKSFGFDDTMNLGTLDNWTFVSSESIMINKNPNKPKQDEHYVNEIYRFLSVPANHSNKQVGQIALANSTRDYTDKDLKFVERIASLYAFVLQRKSIEESLKNSEANYRMLAETARDIIVVHDMFGNIEYINKAGLELSGYSETEILGKNVTELTPKEYHQGIIERMTSRSSGFFNPMIYQLDLISTKGTRIPVEVSSLPIVQNGISKGILLIARDITQRIRSEEARETINIVSLLILSSRSHERLMNELTRLFSVRFKSVISLIEIFDEVNNVVQVYGGESSRVYSEAPSVIPLDMSISKEVIESGSPYIETNTPISDTYCSIGIMKQTINVLMVYPIKTKYNNYGSIIIGGKKPDEINYLMDSFDTISFMLAQEIERKKAENEIKTLNIELEKRVEQRTAELEDTLSVLREENAIRKKAEEDLLNAKDEIARAYQQEKQLSELKTRFISMISHEYRTPLTVILSSAFILEKAIQLRQEDMYDKHLSKIKSSVSVMTQLLENVLIIGKSEAGKMDYYPKSIDLIQVIKEMIEEVEVIDKERHKFVLKHLGNLSSVYTDEKNIRQIVVNLLTNAVKYSEPGTDVAVNVSGYENYIELRVTDRGIGIPEKDLNMIFDSFHRGLNIGAVQGTGIGLTIVKRCVDILNGSISVESKMNQGTTFIVCFPLDKP